MQKRKSIVYVLLLSLSLTLFTPAVPVAASPLLDLLSQNSAGGNGQSGNELVNIILGLLIGKLFGNVSPTAATTAKAPDNSAKAPENSFKTAAAKITPLTSGQAIVASAKKYLGTPYVWGAETPEGFDCSGFTRYVMKQNGVDLPRTAAEQYDVGKPVAKADLQVGDMIFFTTYKPGASHVGFYMGDGKFIHASSVNKEVTISNLGDTYYVEHYIGARRYTD